MTPTAQHISHLETLSSHDEAVAYLNPLNGVTLSLIAKTLDVPSKGNKQRITDAIVANTVDYRIRSQVIRNLDIS